MILQDFVVTCLYKREAPQFLRGFIETLGRFNMII